MARSAHCRTQTPLFFDHTPRLPPLIFDHTPRLPLTHNEDDPLYREAMRESMLSYHQILKAEAREARETRPSAPAVKLPQSNASYDLAVFLRTTGPLPSSRKEVPDRKRSKSLTRDALRWLPGRKGSNISVPSSNDPDDAIEYSLEAGPAEFRASTDSNDITAPTKPLPECVEQKKTAGGKPYLALKVPELLRADSVVGTNIAADFPGNYTVDKAATPVLQDLSVEHILDGWLASLTGECGPRQEDNRDKARNRASSLIFSATLPLRGRQQFYEQPELAELGTASPRSSEPRSLSPRSRAPMARSSDSERALCSERPSTCAGSTGDEVASSNLPTTPLRRAQSLISRPSDNGSTGASAHPRSASLPRTDVWTPEEHSIRPSPDTNGGDEAYLRLIAVPPSGRHRRLQSRFQVPHGTERSSTSTDTHRQLEDEQVRQVGGVTQEASSEDGTELSLWSQGAMDVVKSSRPTSFRDSGRVQSPPLSRPRNSKYSPETKEIFMQRLRDARRRQRFEQTRAEQLIGTAGGQWSHPAGFYPRQQRSLGSLSDPFQLSPQQSIDCSAEVPYQVSWTSGTHYINRELHSASPPRCQGKMQAATYCPTGLTRAHSQRLSPRQADTDELDAHSYPRGARRFGAALPASFDHDHSESLDLEAPMPPPDKALPPLPWPRNYAEERQRPLKQHVARMRLAQKPVIPSRNPQRPTTPAGLQSIEHDVALNSVDLSVMQSRLQHLEKQNTRLSAMLLAVLDKDVGGDELSTFSRSS